MRQPPEKFGRVMSHVPGPAFMLFPFETMWNQARAGTVQAGEMAPDFRLPTLDHKSEVRPGCAARQARGAGVWQLHLTAIPAGGSRPQQTV